MTPFDWELEAAREAGGLAYYELLNKWEEAARQNQVEDPKREMPILGPSEARRGALGVSGDKGGAAGGAKRRKTLTPQEAWDAAEDALRTWGRWITHGEEPPAQIGPRPFRSQFAPPSEGPPPSIASDVAAYVERTPGFGRAKRVLWLTYVEGWTPESREAVTRLETFKNALAERLRTDPWRPPPPPDRRCEAEISEDREKTKAANLNAPKGSLRNRN